MAARKKKEPEKKPRALRAEKGRFGLMPSDLRELRIRAELGQQTDPAHVAALAEVLEDLFHVCVEELEDAWGGQTSLEDLPGIIRTVEEKRKEAIEQGVNEVAEANEAHAEVRTRLEEKIAEHVETIDALRKRAEMAEHILEVEVLEASRPNLALAGEVGRLEAIIQRTRSEQHATFPRIAARAERAERRIEELEKMIEDLEARIVDSARVRRRRA